MCRCGFYYRQVEPVWCSRQAIHSLSWSSPIKDRNPCVSGVRTQTTTQKWTRPLLTRPCCSVNIHYSYYLERNALGIDNAIRFCSICRQMSVSSRLVVFYLYKRFENASERAGWCMVDMDDLSSSGRRYFFKEIKSSGSSTYPPCKYFKKPNSHSQYIFILSIHVKIRILLSKLWNKIFRSRLVYVN